MDGRFIVAIFIGMVLGVALTVIFSCLALDSKLDHEEEKKEIDMHMRR